MARALTSAVKFNEWKKKLCHNYYCHAETMLGYANEYLHASTSMFDHLSSRAISSLPLGSFTLSRLRAVVVQLIYAR
jgi:hypothetical protein